MKRSLILSIAAAVAFAACSQDADAQLFRRWRRTYNNNGYYRQYYGNQQNNGYQNAPASPTPAVPTYRTGANQPSSAAPPTPTLAPRAAVAAPPGAATAMPRGMVPGVVGVTPNGPVVGPVPYEPGNPRVLGDGATPARRAESALLGAGVRPAASKANEGTTVIEQP